MFWKVCSKALTYAHISQNHSNGSHCSVIRSHSGDTQVTFLTCEVILAISKITLMRFYGICIIFYATLELLWSSGDLSKIKSYFEDFLNHSHCSWDHFGDIQSPNWYQITCEILRHLGNIHGHVRTTRA